ncbi:MAG: hypothetical protein EX254_09045 [Flavobacteriaceae bacterium]|nr:hypothetical protein [Flavobacteriaceae bacterium]RZV60313.1 MAG: hypothetical protein EX254_09045 [Flavobacteriaceae bacterium]
MNKIVTIIGGVIGVLAIILLGRIINTGDTTIQSAAKAGDSGLVNGLLDPMAYVAYLVLGIILLLVVVFTLKNMFSHPGALMSTLKGVGSFLVVFAICYFVLANGVETPLRDGEVLSEGGSKMVGAGLFMFYALILIAGGSMLFFGVKKMLK